MFVTLRKLGAADDEAYAFVRGTDSMPGQNVIAEIRVQNAKIDAALETRGAKIDAQSAKINAALEAGSAKIDAALEAGSAKIDAIQREINALRWTIILGFTALAILITVLALLA